MNRRALLLGLTGAALVGPVAAAAPPLQTPMVLMRNEWGGWTLVPHPEGTMWSMKSTDQILGDIQTVVTQFRTTLTRDPGVEDLIRLAP